MLGQQEYARQGRAVRGLVRGYVEKMTGVDVTASAVIAAIRAYTNSNAVGHWVDRSKQVNLNHLFRPHELRGA